MNATRHRATVALCIVLLPLLMFGHAFLPLYVWIAAVLLFGVLLLTLLAS